MDPVPRPVLAKEAQKQLNLSRFYAISQIEYCRNFIFKRNFPIDKLFSREAANSGLWQLTANNIARFSAPACTAAAGKLATVIDQIEHGHHVFRAFQKCLPQQLRGSRRSSTTIWSTTLFRLGLKKGWTISM